MGLACTLDSLLAVIDRGTVQIPAQNYQSAYVKLREAVLGLVEPSPTGPEFLRATLYESAYCAQITAEEPEEVLLDP